MKTLTFWKLSLGLALATLPLAGGCDQESAQSAPATSVATYGTNAPALVSEPAAEATINTNDTTAAEAESPLSDAPGKVMSTAMDSTPEVQLTEPAQQVVKLAQAGVDESVMLTYVTNSSSTFNLSSDAIIYLNDIGVPSAVVTAMMQQDQALKASANALYASSPPIYVNEPQSSSASYSTPDTEFETTTAESSQPQEEAAAAPAQPANVTYNYFYDSLAPYGNWIDISGYGPCWQPTVGLVNPGWQPYCNDGYWVYTDCGWYWHSGYSWGWAPFHYGRWFRHQRYGWCWVPGRTWGPAWVTWRYTTGYCGWAPLPPAAWYTPGIGFTYFGRHVGFSFNFGLSPSWYTFVAINHFTDRHVYRHRLAKHRVHGFFHRTTIAHRIFRRGHTLINEGIPPSRVTAVTHDKIPRVHLHDAGSLAGFRQQRTRWNGDRGLVVYRPKVPLHPTRRSLSGQRAQAGLRSQAVLRHDQTPNHGVVVSRLPNGALIMRGQRRAEPASVGRNRAVTSGRNTVTPNHSAQAAKSQPSKQRDPIILRGPTHSVSSSNERAATTPNSRILTRTRYGQRPPVFNRPTHLTPNRSQRTQPTPTVPAQNRSSRIINQNTRSFTVPGVRSTTSPAGNQGLRQNPNRGVIHRNPNAGVVHQNPNAGVIHRNPNAGVIHQNPNAGVIHQNPNRGFIRQTTPRAAQPNIRAFARPVTPNVRGQTRSIHPAPSQPARSFRSVPPQPRIQARPAPPPHRAAPRVVAPRQQVQVTPRAPAPAVRSVRPNNSSRPHR